MMAWAQMSGGGGMYSPYGTTVILSLFSPLTPTSRSTREYQGATSYDMG